jgi:AcrR family transcriptional regulator
VSPAAPYRHFTNKDALLAGIAAHGFQTITRTLADIISRHPGDFQQQLLSGAEAYIQLAQTYPALVRVMFTCCQSQHPDAAKSSGEAQAMLTSIFQSGQEAGIFASHSLEDMTILAFAFIHGLALLEIDSGAPPRSSSEISILVRNLCAILFEGLSRHP